MSAAVALGGTPSRGYLARAGWGVVSGSRLPGLPSPPATPPPSAEQEGKRVVAEVASIWSQKFIFHIRLGGPKEGLFHYECLFSRPTDDKPVPSGVVAVLFAFLPAVGPQGTPRLFYQFEVGDLRHEWQLTKDGAGTWKADRGQQKLSLKAGAFEKHLETHIREKEVAVKRGINVHTKFEAPRVKPPPAFEYEDLEGFEVPRQASHFSQVSRAYSRTSVGVGEEDEEPMPEDEASREMAAIMEDALKAANMFSTKVSPPKSFPELLANILDAADEEGTGRMTHYEVSRLLMITLPGFGLEEWDIYHLMTYAKEDRDGYIESASLVAQAQDIIFQLRQRRKDFIAKDLPGEEVSNDSIKHCFGEEITVICEELIKRFEACATEDPSRAQYYSVNAHLNQHPRLSQGRMSIRQSVDMSAPGLVQGQKMTPKASNGGFDEEEDEKELTSLKRRYVRECLRALHERISPQEGAFLLQMLPEDESGFLSVDDLADRLENLRAEALHNAVVACNVRALRYHLVTKFRELGLDERGRVKLWHVKDALLTADQVCLSRLQMHVLLCLADPDNNGNVDMGIFAAMCSSIVPHMCSAKIFAETAERLMAEHAEAAKERANAELAALGAARVTNAGDEGADEVEEKRPEADQDTVERTLIQVFSLSDDTRKTIPVLSPEVIFKTLWNPTDQQVQGLGLDELEVAGLLAEMPVDANNEVPYRDFVERWVPIMFELRKNPHLGAYIKDGAAEHLGFPEPDIPALEKLYPLLPPGHKDAILAKKAAERRAAEAAGGAAEGAGGEKIVRRGSKERRGSKDRAPRRLSTWTKTVTVNSEDGDEAGKKPGLLETVEKEPPPGRGFGRRQARVDQKRQLIEDSIASAIGGGASPK